MTENAPTPPPRPRRRGLSAAIAVGVAAATVFTVAAPSHAATCAGYVGLTFDDGPTPGNTPQLLNALKKAGVRATLFNVGEHAQANPALVDAEKAAGMWIGNHSWSHPHLTQLSTSQMTSEITRTQQILQKQTGTAPVLFRPPFGNTNSTLRSIEKKNGLTEVLWDISTGDYDGPPVAKIVEAARRLTNGQVILMHDHAANTVAAIPQIVADLTGRRLCAGMISPTTGRAVEPTS
ncbi:polysaccharide deacetylase family protein [Amycolatopsis sp. H6(2020)]|nr:polysaccharide deacetylase family protein [Amycolatopsis sp. H6(2020)]